MKWTSGLECSLGHARKSAGGKAHVSCCSACANGAGNLKEGTKEVQMILGEKSLYVRR